ncbi:MAG: tRNA uridine-5-carboxymethylaminomethyl(34) synthesis GTPase MnmE [Nitrosomonadales bacterium]|nr:tRNA uridine-5-carboxymethylaminomethyl(34) synthesis GTPase MnmE [Nitrosomonadales bacterium]
MLRPDFIAAIATAPGRGGIGVVRVSGDNLAMLVAALLGKALVPRQATLATFLDAQGHAIDQGIALFFPSPHSYTGDDVLELQGHGGPAVLHLVLQRCLELGARLARPGEFTQRAFLNDKLDLAQAESVADLIDATTSQAARSAMRSLQGEFSSTIHHLVNGLIQLRILVEAMLDFPEEELEAPDISSRNAQLNELRNELEKTLGLAQQGSLLREGAHIVLVGQPNVGKSSLLNRLSGEEVALVSDIPGTTRDVIRQAIQIGGVPLHIVDTAGLRESGDVVEQMGVARTRNTLQTADAILILLDTCYGISAEDQKILDELPPSIPRLHIINKIDLLAQAPCLEERDGECYIYLSAKTGEGLDLLRNRLLLLVGWHQDAGVFMARERHVRALLAAHAHLQRAMGVLSQTELFAEELRLAQEDLSSIMGEFTADDLLGEIFSHFCIGK